MRTASAALLLLLIAPAVVCARSRTYNLDGRNGKRQVTFESKAPVEYIEGEAEEVSGMISVDFERPDLGLRASISVPVDSMRTGMDQRDEHLRSREWLNAQAHPAIRFELDPSRAGKLKPRGKAAWAGTVEGTFFLKGVTKKISVPVTITRDGEERLIVEGRFSVRLADHNVRGPITMRIIGMKVSEIVQVSFRLVGVKDKGWDNVKPRRKLR